VRAAEGGKRPAARTDVVFRALAREWVLYDPDTRKLHVLNLTAALVWSLCDGAHDREEITRSVRKTLEDPPDEATVRTHVADALETFMQEGLLA